MTHVNYGGIDREIEFPFVGDLSEGRLPSTRVNKIIRNEPYQTGNTDLPLYGSAARRTL